MRSWDVNADSDIVFVQAAVTGTLKGAVSGAILGASALLAVAAVL
jgi:hypothetical protein